MSNDYFKAQGWFKNYALNSEDSRGVFQQLVKEDEEAFKLASAETDKIKAMMNKKYGPGTMKYGSEISQPPARPDVIQMDAINAFMKRNPAAEGGRMNFDNGGSADKYTTPAKRTGADDFQGQKFISVKDESYSEGRKRVKTKEYSAWLKNEQEKHKKNPNRWKQMSNPRREPGLIRIAEAMQQADIYDDAEYMMPNKEAMKAREKDFGRKQKIYKKGMLEAADIVYINGLEKNFDDVIFIADQLGEDPDWVLDQLDERTNFRDFAKGEKDILKKDPKYTKPRNDYLKVENWVQKNAKRYANPETFEKALIKRFGKDNQFVKDLKSNKPFVQTYFSEGFTKTMLNKTSSKARSTPTHLNEFIKSSLYNFNPKIKEAVTAEIKGIFNSENLPKLRTEARKLLSNNKLLAKFGLDKAITGPFAKVIQAEIGQQLWDDITNFRQHRVGTQEMLKAFEQIVADEFKPMFNESAKAIGHSKNNQWKKAKEVFGIADNIAWDHKVPSSVIDKGYADIIEYTKVNPTTSNFNERIKNAEFDRKINKEIAKFEKATTLDEKVKIKNNMDIIKDNFSKKYKGYLDEVSINLDEKGNLKFSSSASPLSMSDDRVKMLGRSIIQEGSLDQKKLKEIESYITDRTGKVKQPMLSSGFSGAYEMLSDDLKKITNTEGFKKFSKIAKTPGKFFGIGDVVLGYLDYKNNIGKYGDDEGGRALSLEKAKQAMSFGLWKGGDRKYIEQLKETYIKNGGDESVFDQVISLNTQNSELMSLVEKTKEQYQRESENEKTFGTAGGPQAIKFQLDVPSASDTLKTNLSAIKTKAENMDKDFTTFTETYTGKDLTQPSKDIKAAAFEDLAAKKRKVFKTQSRQLNTEAGPIGNWLLNNLFTTDARGKAKEQAYIDEMAKNYPQELYRYNLERGVDPDNPITFDASLNLMSKPELGFNFSEGGITTLRSKYEYKK